MRRLATVLLLVGAVVAVTSASGRTTATVDRTFLCAGKPRLPGEPAIYDVQFRPLDPNTNPDAFSIALFTEGPATFGQILVAAVETRGVEGGVRCVGTRLRIPLSRTGLPGTGTRAAATAECYARDRVLVRVRATTTAGPRLREAQLAVRVRGTRAPLAFGTISATRSRFWSARRCDGRY